MRLIDADALVKKIKEEASANYCNELYGVANGLRIAETIVNDAPTIDPVKHGRWETFNNAYGVSYCSLCSKAIFNHTTPYCEKCGAKMDKEVPE